MPDKCMWLFDQIVLFRSTWLNYFEMCYRNIAIFSEIGEPLCSEIHQMAKMALAMVQNLSNKKECDGGYFCKGANLAIFSCCIDL